MPPYHLIQRQIFEFWLISSTPLRLENQKNKQKKRNAENLKRPENGETARNAHLPTLSEEIRESLFV